ncbi:hypothetical protein SPRG_01061 [Saprolegnia parasitica CBS 223.65]|uniref:Uncharacterized protein n=1 Tax=Saprolegnia parasitica (strain CBS 223.65) TaxID=695850 RepID=A0A067CWV3_SAPPC|nr:hypothetical protein SPRG_01061 [Saprolegnia parasitica CBS 223.65]KDO34998.1 hypothetical protein SPRG_01061 [Saprolegnia parasitica CBS 223.65]|eukprot:XP_012194651.1 hypothetical protein SPRG_01061 [Saprolegnia parasitica CBS 223.65]
MTATDNFVDLTTPDLPPKVTAAVASFLQDGHEPALATEALGFALAPSLRVLLTQLLPRFAANVAANPAFDVSAVTATIGEGLALTPEYAVVESAAGDNDDDECTALGDTKRKRPIGSFATLEHDCERAYSACKQVVHGLHGDDAARSAFVADAAIVRQRLASAAAIPDSALCALRAEATAALHVVNASKAKEVELAFALEALWRAKRAELPASTKVEVDLAVYNDAANVAAVDTMAAMAKRGAATEAAATILDSIEVHIACYEMVVAVLHEICCLRHAALKSTAAAMDATYADAVAATRAQLHLDLPRLCACLLRFDTHVDAKMRANDGYKADKLRKLDELCFDLPPSSDPEACTRLRGKIKAKTAIAEDLFAHLEEAATRQQYLWTMVDDVLGATECRCLLDACRPQWSVMTPVLRDVFESVELKGKIEVSEPIKAETVAKETVAPPTKSFSSYFW